MVALPPVRKAVRDLIDRTTDKIYGPIPPKTPKPASTETAETTPESISSAPRREIDNFDLDMFSS
jgi:hypothetical protein